jgi:hypothetical protein
MPRRGWALGVALAIGACAQATISPPDTASPHAPGIAVDPVFEFPSALPSAETTRGLVVLAEPVNPEAARTTVDAFFDAVVAESEPDMESVLMPGARLRANAKARPDTAITIWQLRWKKLDYRTLGSGPLYRPGALEIYPPPDSGKSAERPLPLVARKGEILVRVSLGGGRAVGLLGPEIVFAVVCGNPACRITEMVEDFRLP